MPKQVFWLNELCQEDNVLVGKKCANLGEMTKIKMPVPLGFAIAVTAEEAFLEETGARREILEVLEGPGDLKDYQVAAEVSAKIQAIIEGKKMPPAIGDAIASCYEELCSKRDCEVAVSVRSAGIISHPGMYETYLNIKGTQNVLAMVKKVWASIFNHRTVCAAVQHNLPVAGSPCIGVGVIELVNARSAGVCFTVHPTTGDPSTAVIEANWGLGESVVSGQVDIDHYVIDKDSLRVIEKTLGRKEMQIVPKGYGVAEEELPPEMRDVYTLSDDEAKEVVKIGNALESHFGTPQDLEFTIAADRPFPDNIFLLQTRGVVGVTVQAKKSHEEKLKEQLAKRLGRIV